MFDIRKSTRKYSTTFHESLELHKRKGLSKLIKDSHPNKVPIILESMGNNYRNGSDRTIKLDNNRYLCPEEVTLARFLKEIRRHIENVNEYEAIFLFVVTPMQLYLPAANMTILEIYNKYKDEGSDADGFLYFLVSLDNVFGSC